jgi:hypothetical protein
MDADEVLCVPRVHNLVFSDDEDEHDQGGGAGLAGLMGAVTKAASVGKKLSGLGGPNGGKKEGDFSTTFVGAKTVKKWARKQFESVFGHYGDIVMCNIKTVYIWVIFIALFLVAWVRGLLVLNKAFRMHILQLEPYIDPASNSNTGEMVVLRRRASRFVLFAMLFLTIMAFLLFLGVTVLFVWAALQLIQLLADSMPDAIWIFAEVLRVVFGADTFFGAFSTRHFKAHGIVLCSMIMAAFLYAYVFFRESDLLNATFLRDKFLRCIALLPVIAISLYTIYVMYLVIIECF